MKKTMWWLMSCLIALSLALISCDEEEVVTITTEEEEVTIQKTEATAEEKEVTKLTGEGANWWDKYGEPQYGGTLTYRISSDPGQFDPYYVISSGGSQIGSLIYENTAMKDSLQDPEIWGYTVMYTMSRYNAGLIIESWELPDDTTIVMHVREGVTWQNIPPMNGRELTAYDIEFHYKRLLGFEEGYERSSSNAMNPDLLSTESVTATDKYTVVFKCSYSNTLYYFTMVNWIGNYGLTMPREAVEQWGNLSDWEYSVGTGPFIIEDWVSDTSLTFKKNPTYWGYDERYPENRLPYVDTLKVLVIPDLSTAKAALRTGKIELIEDLNWEDAATIADTNPELLQISRPSRGSGLGIRVDLEPFTDIRVRTALQMAINVQDIAESYYGGTTDATPVGLISHYYDSSGYSMPYDDWAPEVQAEYEYNPEGARALLAEAGYPDGFKTNLVCSSGSDLSLYQILQAYLADIGVDMEINSMEPTVYSSYTRAMKHDAFFTISCSRSDSPPVVINTFLTGYSRNYSGIGDAVYDDLHAQSRATFDEDEQIRLTREIDYRVIKQHYMVTVPPTVTYCIYQPWFKAYWGQVYLRGPEFARFWIDQDIKKSMGY